MSRRLSPRRLARWLRGRSSPAGLFGIADSVRDDLAWHAGRLLESGAHDEALRLFDLLGFLWPEAQGAYDGVLATQPENVHALANRAKVRLLTGRVAAARTDLEQAWAVLDRAPGPAALRLRVQELRQHAKAAT